MKNMNMKVNLSRIGLDWMENNKNMKKIEKINRKKEKVNRRENRKIKKKEDEKLLLRPWDALPNLPLFNIFRNLHFKDRFGSIPLVCKAWNSVISDDPRCYSSMIPESISPDDAFIYKPIHSILQVDLPKLLYGWRRRRPVPIGGKSDDPNPGVSYLRSFIKKSSSCSSVGGGGGGDSSSTITSLCLDPFSVSSRHNEFVDHDEILHLIAHCCPNLKHISFDGFYYASREAVLEVFKRCKKIELIDFSDSGYADSVKVIKELGNCLPNLRGIRMESSPHWNWGIATHFPWIGYIAIHFPWIKLHYEKLECYTCEECGYSCYSSVYVRKSLCRVRVNRPRIQPIDRRLCYQCWPRVEEEEAAEAAEEAYLEYLRDEEEDQYSILKEKKERRRYHQYVRVVLRTRMRKKNKKQQQEAAASFNLKMKMRKKRDTYDYQDFYVRAAAF